MLDGKIYAIEREVNRLMEENELLTLRRMTEAESIERVIIAHQKLTEKRDHFATKLDSIVQMLTFTQHDLDQAIQVIRK